MNRETSLYLDIVRFSAALMVFLSHVAGQRFTGGLFWQLDAYGGQRITIFFVLSGFVIGYVIDKRDTNILRFAINRTARLYSVVIPAIVLTLVLDGVGYHLGPQSYDAWPAYVKDHQFEHFLRALTFTNTSWFPISGPGSNLPFWTLGLEASYYLIFGLFVFAKSFWRVAGIAVALIVAGPTAISLLPVWLLGVGSYHVCARLKLKPVVSALSVVVPLLCWAAYECSMIGQARASRAQPQDNLLWTYAVALLFAAHIIGFHGVATHIGGILLRFARPIRWVSGATFSIYLYHLPIIQFLTTVTPWEPGTWQNRILMVPGVLIAVFLLAEVTERRKEWWRGLFNALQRYFVSPMRIRSPLSVLRPTP